MATAQAALPAVGELTPLANAGTVLATFAGLLKQLRDLENRLDWKDNETDRSKLIGVMQCLSLQRNSFEDAAVDLLCDVAPSADISTFFTALGDLQWQEAEVQVRARKRLGIHVEAYCGTCTTILGGLDNIKNIVNGITPPDTMSEWGDMDPNLVRTEACMSDLLGHQNSEVIAGLTRHNHELRTLLDHGNNSRKDGIQAANAVIQTILSLTADTSPAAAKQLAELCQQIREADKAQQRSFQTCLSESSPCGAASTTPYETRSTLRLRWAINHLADVAGFQPQMCCWPACSSKSPFPSLSTFLSHIVICQDVDKAQYACLRRLERAWYDNRCAWGLQFSSSSSSQMQGPWLRSELRWPFEDGEFGNRESPPELEAERKPLDPASEKAEVDIARYKGVVLARKRMRWTNPHQLRIFKEESQTLRRLNHCHVIQIFGSYTKHHDYTLLLYPYCEYTLSRFMEENCQAGSTEDELKCPELLRDRLYLESFFPCLAQALMYIHTNTTRHADIKPANILIKESLAKVEDGRRYHVYIADFGSASTYACLSRTKSFAKSTPKYCAPELAPDPATEDPANTLEWGRAADVFSLGCVFAEMLTVLACEEVVTFDTFRWDVDDVDESFCGKLPRVREWLQRLRKFADQEPSAEKGPLRDYWYRRGRDQAFASWKDTFLATINITASMLCEQQDGRPKIAEVVKRLDVDDCCNREVIPLFACVGVELRRR
ncbi:hypothetical protein AYL99_09894 [Fonsecaea erecta]|uniref:non-specific serine/threonine protein kinase n=1 Tax=Fonsecaea erecta TaxID=1367422 RepID=A0A178Z7Q6_9EURO|nr:hypothetical protein AYL99_09894 [Fonsecaea erecta]OAP55742.1 hypothetical protein AYL99_09894 [Fonsecaea erecta]